MPGMFCEAMVTMKSGSAIETSAGRVKTGATSSTGGASDCAQVAMAPSGSSTPNTITMTKASNAAGTA
ncbi:hypothetical protein D3C72_2394300 [compost metagenome]